MEHKPGNLDGAVDGDKLRQLGGDLLGRMFEAAVSAAVSGDISRGFVANGKRSRAPQFAGIIITQIERFAWTVGNGIVRPRRDLVFAAVDGPRLAASLSRGLKAKGRIGDDVDPRRGRGLAGAKIVTYSLPTLANPPSPLKYSRFGITGFAAVVGVGCSRFLTARTGVLGSTN